MNVMVLTIGGLKDACYDIVNVKTLLRFHTFTDFSYYFRFFSDCFRFLGT